MNKASQLNIENEAAKASFVAWWATMEAQGYSYGFEALCNVWVGFDDGRADLARKVLDAVSSERLTENLDNEGDRGYSQALDDVVRALQNLFAREGVDSTALASALSARDPNNLCEQHKAEYKVFHVGGCLKCWLDSELASRDAEIREVLEGLSTLLRYTHGQPERCWCNNHNSNWTHTQECLAARDLYAKLQPGK